jgi:hypothetical protein
MTQSAHRRPSSRVASALVFVSALLAPSVFSSAASAQVLGYASTQPNAFPSDEVMVEHPKMWSRRAKLGDLPADITPHAPRHSGVRTNASAHQVRQHIHVDRLARRVGDAAWPRPVWGVVPPLAHDAGEVQNFISALRRKIWLG